jgi:predicted peroxiredoxin/TusA-related sulfurtransferase
MTAPPAPVAAASAASLDLRGLTITTAIAYAIHEALEPLAQGEALEVTIGTAPALVPDLEAWTRQSGHGLEVVDEDAAGSRLRITKGQAERSGHHVAIVISQAGLEELLSPLGFALAAALEGAAVSVYIQGPAVRVLRPGWSATLPWPMRPFTRFARTGLEAAGHVAAIEKLRQLRSLGGRVYACGPSLAHFGVDPHDLALPDVIVCEYLTFMAVMQEADVQLYP